MARFLLWIASERCNVNIVDKMKSDWNRRASHRARFWIATEDYQTEETFDRSGEETARAIASLLGARESDLMHWDVLDIGCGLGRVLKPMAARARSVTGIDVSKEMIEASKARLQGISNAETLEGSGVDLTGLSPASFDLVYSYVAFQHMPRPVFARYLEEAHRVLRPNGSLVFQLYLGPRREPPMGDTIALRVYEEAELATRLRESGFRVINRALEHRAEFGMESWLVLAARLESPERARTSDGWIEEPCDDTRSPLDHHLYRHLASTQLEEGDRPGAIETMRRHLEFDREDLTVALELTALLIEDGRAEEAIDALTALLVEHPDYTDGYLASLQLQLQLGRTAEALALSQIISEKFPDDAQLLARAGRAVEQAMAKASTSPAPERAPGT